MRSDLARKFFRLCYGYVFFLLIMELVIRTTGEPNVAWITLLALAGLYAGNYLLRDVVQHIWPVILYTILADVGIWFLLPVSPMQRSMLMGLGIGLMFTASRYIRSGGILPEPMDIPWPIFLVGLLATVFGLTYQVSGLVPIAAVLTGIGLIFYLLILYSDSLRKYADSTKDVKGIPIRQMLKINTWIIVVIFLCMVVAILLGEALHMPDAFVHFGAALVSLLKTFFLGLILAIKWIGQLFKIGSTKSYQESAQQLKQEVTESGAFTNILEVALKVILLALVLFLLVQIMYRLIRAISKRYRKDAKELVVETEKKDIRERIAGRGPIERFRKYVSMEERARRIYKKRIMECRKDRAPAGTETTGDILEVLRTEEGIELPELTELYNRVRYGNTVPDRAYLARMRRADK